MSLPLLKRLLARQRFHVSPFVVLGDPTPPLSVELARAAASKGVSMLEIGLPYGDPVADGPAIQSANLRALRGGTSTTQALRILSRIREACPGLALNLLVYGNLVHARGYERFCRDAAAAGASSLLVPDIPLEESRPLRAASRKAGLGHVELVGPLTDDRRLQRIEAVADAFLYLVAHQGVTGVRDGSFDRVTALVESVQGRVRRPLCLGFGLSRPEHILRAGRAGARIAVIGSCLARSIEAAWNQKAPDRERAVVRRFTEALQPLVGASEGRLESSSPGRSEPPAEAGARREDGRES